MRVPAIVLFTALATISLHAQQGAPSSTFNVAGATILSADTIEAARKQSVAAGTVDRLIQGVNVPGGKTALAMLYRTKPEVNALIHEHVTEIYQVIEGSGTLTTGGRLTGVKPTDLSNLWAGPSLSGVHEGGETRRVGPKDVIIVPAGTAHRFSQLDGPITYLVYRFEALK
jgi:mannose-6-phosphate isomerase-like protein (cupin superfamily)